MWPHNHSRPRNPRHTATCTKSFFRHLRRGLCPPTSFSPRPLPKLRPFGFLLSLPRAFLPPLVRRSVLPASLLAVQSSALNPLPLPLRPVLRGGWNPLLVRILSRSAPTCLRCSEKTPLPAPRSGAGVVHIYKLVRGNFAPRTFARERGRRGCMGKEPQAAARLLVLGEGGGLARSIGEGRG